MPSSVLAIDIGATKIALALVDGAWKVKDKVELSIAGLDSDQLWLHISDTTQRILKESNSEIVGVGIGSAGPIDINQGTISPVNIGIWRNFPIVENFQDLTGINKVLLRGDAMLLALAEHVLGAGRGLENMLGMVVSTGIGGGLIINSELFLGDSGNTSFVGHQSIDFEGELCACGRNGCVESIASGPQMVRFAKSIGWDSGTQFEDLADSARKGDNKAIQAIERGTRALASGIINTLAGVDIHHVIIGGGVTQAGDIFWIPLLNHVARESRHIDFLDGKVELRRAQLERDAGLIGCALAVIHGQKDGD